MGDLQPHLGTGDRMRLAMKRSRLTPADMAAHTSVTTEQVSAWLGGHEAPDPAVLETWSLVTGASVSWLRDAPTGAPASTRRYVRGSRSNKPET